MIEEEHKDTTTITNEDLGILRVLLHNIRGISAVSTTAYTQRDEQSDE